MKVIAVLDVEDINNFSTEMGWVAQSGITIDQYMPLFPMDEERIEEALSVFNEDDGYDEAVENLEALNLDETEHNYYQEHLDLVQIRDETGGYLDYDSVIEDARSTKRRNK